VRLVRDPGIRSPIGPTVNARQLQRKRLGTAPPVSLNSPHTHVDFAVRAHTQMELLNFDVISASTSLSLEGRTSGSP
jgi:hypothetical protein